MKIRYLVCCATIILGVGLVGKLAPAQSSAPAPVAGKEEFTATVTNAEAKFEMPRPSQKVFQWRQAVTKDNGREYQMAVKVTNAARQYYFGFYLWKRPGATPQSGGLDDLLAAGQKSLFERVEPRRNQIIRGANLKVRSNDGSVVITVSGKGDVARLFSGRPAEVTFEITLPGEPTVSRTVPITYK